VPIFGETRSGLDWITRQAQADLLRFSTLVGAHAMVACRRQIVRSVPTWALILCIVWVGRMTAATDAQCRDLLRQALEAKQPETRKQAVVALSLVAAQFLSPLTAMLQDKDVEVRLATVVTLTEVKSNQTVAALRAALNDEVPEVSFAAAKALWGFHDTAGKRALLAVLAGDSQTSSNFLSKQKRDALRMMHSPRIMLMFAMNKGIGFVPVPYLGLGVASIQALLTDPGVSGRAAAALMLARETDAATLEALRDALSDTDWSVRAAAVHSLALRKDPQLRIDLAPLIDDQNEAVRMRAAAAYLRLEGQGRTPNTAGTR
jgi:HEAT repeat protein